LDFISLSKKSQSTMLSALIIISSFSFILFLPIQAQPTNSTCEVRIAGGGGGGSGSTNNMYPGQFVHFIANITQGVPQNYTWTIEGPIIKDYDDNVYNSTYLTASLNIEPPTPMSTADFQKPDISFYWQPNKTDTIRTVSVLVQTVDGTKCQDSKDYTVTKNNDDINLQAEDFYVEQNHPIGLAPDNRIMTRVLSQHQQWHRDFPQLNALYANNGDLFFDFHRIYIAHFDAWRNLFGYAPIVAWDPSTPLPIGIDVNHTKRSVNDETNPYLPLALSPWFRNQPGADGPEDRHITFVRSFPGQNQLPPGHPLAGSGLQIDFFGPIDPNDPDIGRFAYLNGHTLPMCEEIDYPKNSSKYPRVQDALNDFEPDQKLLGCALTDPFHDDRHGAVGGDMASTASSPRDPIFWRFHKFIDNIAVQRFFPPFPPSMGFAITAAGIADTIPPQIISQNPFRLYPFITSLPTISDKEKGLFGISGVPAISAQFNEPVTGVKASDFTINGSAATQVSGTGAGPYVFIGFKPPSIGPINVTLSSGNIIDIAGNKFEGSSWKYYLVKPNADRDRDGVQDTLEVNVLRTNPTVADSDGDSIPDGIEGTSKCLNPLVNDAEVMDMSMRLINKTGLDTDRDNKTNVQEFSSKSDPCLPQSQTSLSFTANRSTLVATASILQPGLANRSSGSSGMNTTENMTTIPFALVIKKTRGIAGTTGQLQFDSFTKEAISTINGTKSSRQVSDADEAIVKRILNDSGYFDSKSFYPSAPNSADYFEYTAIAILNGKLHAVYWTDTSEDVPNGIKNLPFILEYILRTGEPF
jgi:hypothetical protein